MSGLTGYLTTSGIDLSYVFMPKGTGGGGASLAENNTFSGTNAFNGGLSTNAPITYTFTTLPTYSTTQIGYSTIIRSNIGFSTVADANVKNLLTAPFTFPAVGLYMITLSLFVRQTAVGNAFIMFSQYSLNTVSATIYPSGTSNINGLHCQGGTHASSFSANDTIYIQQTCQGCYINSTTQNFYFTAMLSANALTGSWAYNGGLGGGCSIYYTRIA